MSVFEHHHRARIFNVGQHPLRHTPEEITYVHEALPGVNNLKSAFDWFAAVLYPRTKDAVDTPADLPTLGNTLLDFRVVTDDGDGKAAAYRWEQREGDATAKWYKIYDMDWGEGTILARFLDQTQDLYVYKQGIDDLDSSGTVLAGVNAGQHVYGGASASTNLTFHANAGDGVGAQTGYVQTADHFRPTSNNALDLGTTALKFRTIYAATSVLAGTLTASAGSIVDSSGAISFDNENLSTTGNFSGAVVTATTSFVRGTTTITAGNIADSGGAFSFNALNVSTTGYFSGTTLKAGNMTLGTGSITDVSGAISFDNENLSTTGTFQAATITATTSFVRGTLTIIAAQITDSSGSISFDNENLSTTGTLAAGDTTVTGFVSATNYAQGGNLRLTSNTLSSQNADGNIALSPNGTGVVTVSSIFKPTTDAARDLGATALRWQNIYLSGSIGDGTNTISVTNLLTFRAVGSPASGDSLFWDGSKWVASAPDTEITHSTLSGLTTGDAGHTQFALLAGRSGGQTLNGDTAASGNLTLDSTAHATKGKILAKSTIAANTDASFSVTWSGVDLGGSGNRFRHVYTAGEFFGLRAENLASDATPAASAAGRLWWNTTSKYLAVDTGTVVQRLSIFRWESDTSWDGSTLLKNVTVSDIDATKALWQLKDNTNDYEIMQVKITATSTTNVRITTNVALPAGSYRLIGLQ